MFTKDCPSIPSIPVGVLCCSDISGFLSSLHLYNTVFPSFRYYIRPRPLVFMRIWPQPLHVVFGCWTDKLFRSFSLPFIGQKRPPGGARLSGGVESPLSKIILSHGLLFTKILIAFSPSSRSYLKIELHLQFIWQKIDPILTWYWPDIDLILTYFWRAYEHILWYNIEWQEV